MLEVDCSEDGAVDKLRDTLDKVFHSMAMRVLIEIPFEEESQVAELVSTLRESLSNLHFTK